MNKRTLLVFSVCILIFSFSKAAAQTSYSEGLRAVLVVGHLEASTGRSMKEMDKIGLLLEGHGVKVEKFYDRKAVWKDIAHAARGANFFIYSGHGTNLGGGDNPGGLCVQPTVPAVTVRQELKLASNALVVFQSVCYGAGSSAGDAIDIGPQEAENRVGYYALPFFSTGATGYYANNFIGGAHDFLAAFLAGRSLGEAYVETAIQWTTIEFEKPYEQDSTKRISVASRPGGGTTTLTTYTNGRRSTRQVPVVKGYVIAYVGEPDFSIDRMRGKRGLSAILDRRR